MKRILAFCLCMAIASFTSVGFASNGAPIAKDATILEIDNTSVNSVVIISNYSDIAFYEVCFTSTTPEVGLIEAVNNYTVLIDELVVTTGTKSHYLDKRSHPDIVGLIFLNKNKTDFKFPYLNRKRTNMIRQLTRS